MYNAGMQDKSLEQGARYSYHLDVLERKRLEMGLSYTDIAERLGVSQVTVTRTLRGVNMKPRTVKLLADFLGVEMERLVQVN